MRRRRPPLPDRSAGRRTLSHAATLRQHACPISAVVDARGAMSDDRPRAPIYGPPITVPSGEFLGRIAYHAWLRPTCRVRPSIGWS
jgi:hypothetical protein